MVRRNGRVSLGDENHHTVISQEQENQNERKFGRWSVPTLRPQASGSVRRAIPIGISFSEPTAVWTLITLESIISPQKAYPAQPTPRFSDNSNFVGVPANSLILPQVDEGESFTPAASTVHFHEKSHCAPSYRPCGR